MDRLFKFFRDEKGATVPEYALMVALIAAVVIGVVTLLGHNISTTFNNVAGQFPLGS